MILHWTEFLLCRPGIHFYRITGTNFTPSSQVKLNGEWYDTVYVNPTTLMISGTDWETLTDFLLFREATVLPEKH